MTMRTYLLLLVACAGLGTLASVVQSQDLPSQACAPHLDLTGGGSGLIWAFD